MNSTHIPYYRLHHQHLTQSVYYTASDLIQHMGAIQGQDFPMSKWALGVRLAATTDAEIQESFDKGEILRSHLMRPTWHLVAAEDIVWMSELSAPQIRSAMNSRHIELGLDEITVHKSLDIMGKVLSGNTFLNRDEVMLELEKEGISTDSSRAAHLMMLAETEALVCSGPMLNNKQTYALISERVKKPLQLNKEESLYKLAERYFNSHGPATTQDYHWWSGLKVADIRKSIQLISHKLKSETIDNQEYWYNPDTITTETPDTTYLLPAYDEFLISYKDRSSSLPAEHLRKSVSDNGIFRPMILENGRVTGLWKRIPKKDNLIIEAHFFNKSTKKSIKAVEMAAGVYSKFMNKNIQFVTKD